MDRAVVDDGDRCMKMEQHGKEDYRKMGRWNEKQTRQMENGTEKREMELQRDKWGRRWRMVEMEIEMRALKTQSKNCM